MGWKALKEAFGIKGHTICVTEKGICIGSGYRCILMAFGSGAKPKGNKR